MAENVEAITHVEGPLLCKSEVELQETEVNKRKALEQLTRYLIKETNKELRTPLDEDFLLLFLRARKFKADKAHALILAYYNVRLQHADILSDFTPRSVRVVFERGAVIPLQRQIPLRPLTILVRVSQWDLEEMTLENIFKAMLITMEHTLRSDATNQIAGYNFIFDMEYLTLSHVTQFTPRFANRAMSMFENAFPGRVKALHHINVPTIVEGVFQVFRPFLSDKMKKRFVVSSSRDFVMNTYPSDEVPEYLGGVLNLQASHQHWLDTILTDKVEREFMARAQWGYTKSVPRGNTRKTKESNKDIGIRYDKCLDW